MRTSTLLAATGDFSVHAVTCPGGHRDWSPAEPGRHHGIVLVRAGFFHVRCEGSGTLAEPTTAYVQVPGSEFEFAHPGGGDACTSVAIAAELWHGAGRPPAAGPIPLDGHLELAHRQLLRATCTQDPGYALAERLVHLVSAAARVAADRDLKVGGSTRGSTAGAELTAAAREAIVAGDPAAAGLVSLARALGVSPFHLSRAFSAHAGMSLTRCRNRIRASRALARIDAGERDLARLADDLGFADQAHLTRTVKAEFGRPPGALRAYLEGIPRPAAGRWLDTAP
jgi:AraC-like DNA-binding protein